MYESLFIMFLDVLCYKLMASQYMPILWPCSELCSELLLLKVMQNTCFSPAISLVWRNALAKFMHRYRKSALHCTRGRCILCMVQCRYLFVALDWEDYTYILKGSFVWTQTLKFNFLILKKLFCLIFSVAP